jgi:hypothetical protein
MNCTAGEENGAQNFQKMAGQSIIFLSIVQGLEWTLIGPVS